MMVLLTGKLNYCSDCTQFLYKIVMLFNLFINICHDTVKLVLWHSLMLHVAGNS